MTPMHKPIVSVVLCIIVASFFSSTHSKQYSQRTAVDEVSDLKDFKKILRTKNNVLVNFVSSLKQAGATLKIFKEAAEAIKGQGTMLLVDCSSTDARKMCKKLKVSPDPVTLKHYKDGDFHKDYDRLLTVPSMVNFMRDPSGDIPWEEDSTAVDVAHISDAQALVKFLRKESLPIMVMFYAPWCGFCKQLKPDYAAAATELKGHAIMAAIDVNRPENSVIRQQYNITGFPTLLYFENGIKKYTYEGENNKEGLVNFMKNPSKPPEKPKETDWSDVESEVVHLNAENFDSTIKEEPSVLVMFYAPWCGHCKKMKPEYEQAAEKMKDEDIPGILAAVDATKDSDIAGRYNIKGYPTVKYFRNGELAFDVNVRETGKIVEFMKDPKEPPPPPPPEMPWSDEQSEVVHLTDGDFKSFLKKKKHVLVMFYAPWCGHCKKAKPEFTKAAEKFKDDSRVEFAAVDCTKYSSLCSTLNVKGYPTIKYFHYYNKNSKDYNGGRMEQDFVKFMSNPLDPNAGEDDEITENWGEHKGAEYLKYLADDNFDEAISSSVPILVMFYAPWCGHCTRMKPAFALAAKELIDEKIEGALGVVDATVHRSLQERYSIKGFPTLKVFRNGKFIQNYEEARTTDAIKKFMKSISDVHKDEL